MKFYHDLTVLQVQIDRRIIALQKLRDAVSDVIALEDGITLQANRGGLDLLTETERELLKLIGKNVSRAEILKARKIEVKTFYTHRDNIRKKLSLETTQELKRYAESLRGKES